jgi:hypothetical protein
VGDLKRDETGDGAEAVVRPDRACVSSAIVIIIIVIVIIVVKLYRRIRSNQLIAAISRYFLSGNGAFQSNKNQH